MRRCFLLVLLAFTAGCGSGASTPTTPTPTTKTYTVEYRVTSVASYPPAFVSLTYENQTGGTSQTSRTALPWSYTLGGGTGKFVYVSAQNDGGIYVNGINISAAGSRVEILLNGQAWKTSYASGNFSIGTASGSLP